MFMLYVCVCMCVYMYVLCWMCVIIIIIIIKQIYNVPILQRALGADRNNEWTNEREKKGIEEHSVKLKCEKGEFLRHN